MNPTSASLATALLRKPWGQLSQALAGMLPGTESFVGAALPFSQLHAKNPVETPGYGISLGSALGL